MIEDLISKFLNSETPEVIAIKGPWGVGKTYAWKKHSQKISQTGQIRLSNYSYVSLFGIDNIKDIKQAIFQNTVSSKNINKNPNLTTIRKDPYRVRGLVSKVINHTSKLDKYSDLIHSLSYFVINKAIICFDDIERKSAGLEIRAFMGLINQLKEEKNCKIVMILNNDDLKLDDFELLREKVIDKEINYTPSIEEQIEIVFNNNNYKDIAEEYITKLNIINIRVLFKIKSFINETQELGFFNHKDLKREIISTIILFCYIFYCRNNKHIPPIKYILNKKKEYDLIDKSIKLDNSINGIIDNEFEWDKFLEEYSFTTTNTFINEIANGVTHGYFNHTLLNKYSEERVAYYSRTDFLINYKSIWSLYRNSFKDNLIEFTEKLYTILENNMQDIYVEELNEATTILLELKQLKKARELIELFIQQRGNEIELFNTDIIINNIIRPNDILIDMFNNFYKSRLPKIDKYEIFIKILNNYTWDDNEISILTNLSDIEIIEIIKKHEGKNHNKLIMRCIGMSKINNLNEEHKRLSIKIIEALKSISQESTINRSRIGKYIKYNSQTM